MTTTDDRRVQTPVRRPGAERTTVVPKPSPGDCDSLPDRGKCACRRSSRRMQRPVLVGPHPAPRVRMEAWRTTALSIPPASHRNSSSSVRRRSTRIIAVVGSPALDRRRRRTLRGRWAAQTAPLNRKNRHRCRAGARPRWAGRVARAPPNENEDDEASSRLTLWPSHGRQRRILVSVPPGARWP